MSSLITRFALGFVILAVILLLATGNFFSPSPFVIGAQVFSLAVMIWARRSFPSKSFRVDAAPGADAIIRGGPYRWIRHPMYAGALIIIWAAVLAHLSLWTLSIGAIATVVSALRIVFEEHLLHERYPDYAAYARETKAIIPFIL